MFKGSYFLKRLYCILSDSTYKRYLLNSQRYPDHEKYGKYRLEKSISWKVYTFLEVKELINSWWYGVKRHNTLQMESYLELRLKSLKVIYLLLIQSFFCFHIISSFSVLFHLSSFLSPSVHRQTFLHCQCLVVRHS